MIKCALCGTNLEEVNEGSAMHTAKGCALSGVGAWDENWEKINAAIKAATVDQRKPGDCQLFDTCARVIEIPSRKPNTFAFRDCCPCRAWKR